MPHTQRWHVLLVMFGALLLAACNQETPTPQPQPVSVIVLTATFTPTPTPTPTITSTPTPLPREKIEPVEGMEGWYWVYGRREYWVAGNTDFLYRAMYHSDAWELSGGPVLYSKVLTNCSLQFFDGFMGVTGIPQRSLPGARDLEPPSDIASTFVLQNMQPFTLHIGMESDAGFERAAENCQRAGQAVIDTIQLAPPSLGFVPTPTPLPYLFVRLDDRDPAWSTVSLRFFNEGRRANFYIRTADWRVNPQATGFLQHTALSHCEFGVVEAGGTNWGSETQLIVPQPAPPPEMAQERLALLVMYWDANEDERVACIAAAQRVADTLWIGD